VSSSFPELPFRPGERLFLVRGGVACEQERSVGAVVVAEQLARIRNARIGRDARLQPRHRVEGAECLRVAAELDERVADDAVAARGRRRELQGVAAEHERGAEPVA